MHPFARYSLWDYSFPFLLVLLWGIFTTLAPAKTPAISERQDKLNGGYYLLHHLCENESNLPLLLAVKHAPPDIVDYADKISKTAKESLIVLNRMQEGDRHLKFDKNPLPSIEQDVRESIHDDKQHQLLFGTTGSEFVHALLVSQVEASTYALNLAKVLADQEKDSDRVAMLQRISAKWLALRDESYHLLRN